LFNLFYLLIILSIVFIPSLNTFSEENAYNVTPQIPENIYIAVNDVGLITLISQDTPISEVVERLTEELDIKLKNKNTENPEITVNYEERTIGSIINGLRHYADIVYISKSEDKGGKILEMLVFNKGASDFGDIEVGDNLTVNEEHLEKDNSSSETIKFSFDPKEHMN